MSLAYPGGMAAGPPPSVTPEARDLYCRRPRATIRVFPLKEVTTLLPVPPDLRATSVTSVSAAVVVTTQACETDGDPLIVEETSGGHSRLCRAVD